MNFLEIINKTLLELNYRSISQFDELNKLEHTRIKDIINRVNREICHSFDWWFLQRKMQATLFSGDFKIPNPVNGRIETIENNGNEYRYSPNYRAFFLQTPLSQSFSLFNGELLFSRSNSDVDFDIYYYTNYCARSEAGDEKSELEYEKDESLIPTSNVEALLVYGTCMRVKANPQHPRFKYWFSMYNTAIENLRSRSDLTTDTNPNIVMFRA